MVEPTNIAQRQRIMTALLWVALGLSLAIAAGLIQLKNRLWRVDLAEPAKIGSVEIRAPKNWRVRYERNGPIEEIEIAEPRSPHRILDLRVLDSNSRISAGDILSDGALMQMMTINAEDIRYKEEVTLPGAKGYIIHPLRGNSFSLINLENGRSVLLRILTRTPPSAADDAIVYDVTRSIRGVETGDAGQEPSRPVRASPRGHEI